MTPDLRVVARWLEITLGSCFAVMAALLVVGSVVFRYQTPPMLALASGLLMTGFWVPSAQWPRTWILPRKVSRGAAIAAGVFFLSF